MNQRQHQIVQAAYHLIVDKGLEGFRTRDVAAKAAINTATLHYYFPTKETLIQGVVLYLIEELKKPLVPQRKEHFTASERLQLEFRDVSVRIREAPDQLLVLNELAIRSWRDPAIARILGHLDEQWRGHLSSILKQGIAEGEFRSDLNVVQTANSIMTQLRGLGLQVRIHPEQMERLVKQMAVQTSHWVMRGKPSGK
jgi:AcrR family transcriptional regulator